MPFFRRTPAPAPTREQLLTPLGMVDPGRLLQGWTVYPYNPSWLASRKGLAIYDVMKRDEQVKAALRFKKHTVVVPGWGVNSPKGQSHDWEVSEFIRWNLTHLNGGFHNALSSIMTALDYGFSVSEKIYAEVEKGPYKGLLRLKQLNSCKPHWMYFIQDEFGKLLAIRQINTFSAEIELPPEKFVVYSYTKEFENLYGQSDLESAYRPWWIKDNAYRWLSVALERYGMPPTFAFYNPDAYVPAQIDDLKTIITKIQNGTFGVLPRKIKDDLELWSQQIGRDSNGIFVQALQRLDGDIAKALLIPSLIGFTTDQSHGSNARSVTQFKSFIQVILHLQAELADMVINDQIIPQLCDLNFPGLSEYPRFQFMPFEDENKMELLKTWQALVEGRIVNRIEDDEEHIRKIMDFPDNENPTLEPLPLPKGSAGAPGPGQEATSGSETKPMSEEELTDDMRAYATENDCEWRTVKGHPVCIRSSSTKARVARALATHKPATIEKQHAARTSEDRVAKMVGGKANGDHEPTDVTVKLGGRTHGVEVKTFFDNSRDAITMHPESLSRKVSYARREGVKLHTVVIDARNTFAQGRFSGQYSGHEVYYRSGVGSYRLGAMVRVRDASHLKALINGTEK